MKRALCLLLVVVAVFAIAATSALARAGAGASVAPGESEDEATRLYNEAQKLAATPQNTDDLVKAVQKFEQALGIFIRFGNWKGAGLCFNELGRVYKDRWGQYDKAKEYFGRYLAIAEILKDRNGESIALNNLAGVHREEGAREKAREYYAKSLAICRELKDRRGEAMALGNLGLIYSDLSQYDKAWEHYQKALTVAQELKHREIEWAVLTNLGDVCRFHDDADAAADYYEKSLATARELQDLKFEGGAINNLGIVHRVSGRYEKAIDCYEKSLVLFRKLKDHNWEANALGNLGNVYTDWGQYEKAVEFHEKALAIRRDLKDRHAEAVALGCLGRVYKHLGQYDKAGASYEESLITCRQLGDRRGEGGALTDLGEVLQHKGRLKEALDHFEHGLAIFAEIKLPTYRPKILIAGVYMDQGDLQRAEQPLREVNNPAGWGRFNLLRGEYAVAATYYELILKSAEETRNANTLFTAYTGLAVAYEGLKDDTRAAEYYAKAIKHTEDLRSSLAVPEREKIFDVRINGFYRTEPYKGLARVLMRLNKPLEAFKTSEYTKARVFAERAGRSSGGQLDASSEIRRADQELSDQLAAHKKRLQEGYEKGKNSPAQPLAQKIKALEEQLATHKTMLREKCPLFAATRYPEPTDLAQSALKEDEWTLSYDVMDKGFVVYLTNGKNLTKALWKPVPKKDLARMVEEFRNTMESEGHVETEQLAAFDLVTGKQLADLLLGDIIALLPRGTAVMVIPDECLGTIPFEMLVLNSGGKMATDTDVPHPEGVQFFGDRNPISYSQSISALTVTRTLSKLEAAGRKVLVMDDPVFEKSDPRVTARAKTKQCMLLSSIDNDRLMSIKTEKGLRFPRLPHTAELGSGLKQLDPQKTDRFTGFDAKKTVLWEKPLTEYGSIVFATHGYFGKDLPGIMEPVLILTLLDQPPGKDGFLRMSEVLGLKMNANVVALTACQTGVGRRISGEGTMNMGRAFQSAGAKTVLMSLWSVGQKASVKLTESFLKHIREGKPKLEALKLARQEIRQSGYDHPFFWAAFILAGEVQ